MYRKSDFDDSQRVDVFHIVEDFIGEPINVEPHKCDDLFWFNMDQLSENVIPYIRFAIESIKKGEFYSEHGW